MKIQKLKKARFYKRLGLLHGDKNGAPVLIDESSWRTISGFFVNTRRTGMLCIEFRNHD